jgi:hypothetical protein
VGLSEPHMWDSGARRNATAPPLTPPRKKGGGETETQDNAYEPLSGMSANPMLG